MRSRTRRGRHPNPSADPSVTLERLRDDLERTLDEIGRTHAGRPQPFVLDSLEKAVAAAAVTPRRADLSALARRIAGAHPEGPTPSRSPTDPEPSREASTQPLPDRHGRDA